MQKSLVGLCYTVTVYPLLNYYVVKHALFIQAASNSTHHHTHHSHSSSVGPATVLSNGDVEMHSEDEADERGAKSRSAVNNVAGEEDDEEEEDDGGPLPEIPLPKVRREGTCRFGTDRSKA